jgi:hypothetical protein
MAEDPVVVAHELLRGHRHQALPPVEEFAAAMDDKLGALQDMPTADGHERVYTAGQPQGGDGATPSRHRHSHSARPRPAMQRRRVVSGSKAS